MAVDVFAAGTCPASEECASPLDIAIEPQSPSERVFKAVNGSSLFLPLNTQHWPIDLRDYPGEGNRQSHKQLSALTNESLFANALHADEDDLPVLRRKRPPMPKLASHTVVNEITRSTSNSSHEETLIRTDLPICS